MKDEKYSTAAKVLWGSAPDVAIDPDAEVEQVDGGAWVAARVWVSTDDAKNLGGE